MKDVKQKHLMDEMEIPHVDRKALRDRLLSPNDWYKQGTSVMIRHSGIVKLRVWKEEPNLVAEIRDYCICRKAPNPRFVYINVEGLAYPCVIPMKMSEQLTPGKMIRVQVVKDKDGVSYRHESLG